MRFTVYSKPECCLCDEAQVVLTEFALEHPIEIETIDISNDPALMTAYGERVPVVLIDGIERFQYKVHPKRLRLLVKRLKGPGAEEKKAAGGGGS